MRGTKQRKSGWHRAVRMALAVPACVLVLGCEQVSAVPYSVPEPPVAVELPAVEPPLSCPVARAYRETGKASWYGRFHHGERTASGERFDMNALTAAHRSLPFGTRIRVTNLQNNRSVVLVVNDRGPFVRGRVIDVSQRAARFLKFFENGIAPVRIESLETC